MLEDGDQTKSFRMSGSEWKLDLLPLQNISKSSSLSILLQTRSETWRSLRVNVTLGTWFKGYQLDDGNILETFIDKPLKSAPSINYFYTSYNNTSYFSNYSKSYLRVNVEQGISENAKTPFFCSVVSIQNATNSPIENDGLIKR